MAYLAAGPNQDDGESQSAPVLGRRITDAEGGPESGMHGEALLDWKELGREVSPPFIQDLAKGDTLRARDCFCHYALAVLRHWPPRLLSSLAPQDREDIVQEILVYFLQNEMRVLRQYRPQGNAFESWFLVVATRKALALVRIYERWSHVIEVSEIELPSCDRDLQSVAGGDCEAVEHMQRELSAYQILLWWLRAYQVPPREAARTLGWKPSERSRKKVSDDTRYVARLLRPKLEMHMSVKPLVRAAGSHPASRGRSFSDRSSGERQ